MASLMEDLADVLLQEDKQYQELIVLSKEKTDVLVAGNVKRLEEITAMEQEMTDVLHGYEVRRRTILQDMAGVLGKSKDDFTIETMIQILESQPKEQSRLISLRDKQDVKGNGTAKHTESGTDKTVLRDGGV